jgi:hypothetical protein
VNVAADIEYSYTAAAVGGTNPARRTALVLFQSRRISNALAKNTSGTMMNSRRKRAVPAKPKDSPWPPTDPSRSTLSKTKTANGSVTPNASFVRPDTGSFILVPDTASC